MTATFSLDHARSLDAADSLAQFRARFAIPDPLLIYLDGNSLGRQPLVASALAHDLVERQWGNDLIRAWNHGWLELPERIGAKLAAILGAQPSEVILADSTSVNLFKLAVAALRARPGRTKILTDDLNFPSDFYILQEASALLGQGHTLERIPSPDGIHGPLAGLLAALDEDTALLSLSHTIYRSGFTYDLAALTAAAHAVGALVLWDLSHSAGALPVNLSLARADLAVGCTYKHLNGGPGSPAYICIRSELQSDLHNPIPGWMGRDDMFGFQPQYAPDPSLRRFLTGTPPIFSSALIEPGLDLILEAGIENIRAKSAAQTAYFIDLWESLLKPLDFALQSPTDPTSRGAHVALSHPHAAAIDQALIHAHAIIPDFRPPNVIRFGFSPLYTTFEEVFRAARALVELTASKSYIPFQITLPKVT
ncbi:MAG: kynureninase [Anaerolineae bacterium]|nr:MAG: kynureninase [Anaerolineae bacterium]